MLLQYGFSPLTRCDIVRLLTHEHEEPRTQSTEGAQVKTDRTELAKLAFMGLSKRERRAFLAVVAESESATATAAPGPDRLLRRADVASMLARSPRAVDRLAYDGALPRVMLPGRRRGAGFRLADVQRLIGAD
jgi:hypothetical protein